MTKNPFINALAAAAYIVVIVFGMNYVAKQTAGHDEGLIMPMAMLSLFTLSAAVMGYLFVSQPVLLYLDGKKKEAVSLFVRTTGVFAVLTILTIVAVLVRSGG